jgi:hypothetical protein
VHVCDPRDWNTSDKEAPFKTSDILDIYAVSMHSASVCSDAVIL